MENLDKILSEYVAVGDNTANRLLGAAFIVCNKDGVLYQGAAGRIDIAPDSPVFSVDTWTWAASMAKIVTMTGVMALVEKGSVGLDDDMRTIVPELGRLQILRGFTDETPILEDNTEPITLRHLLTHGAGIGTDIADPELMKWSQAVGRTATCLDYTLEGWSVPMKFPPGEGWYYGGATEFAGVALERITGMKLSEYMSEHVFKPLGMEDTTFYRESMAIKVADRTSPCTMRDPETGALSAMPWIIPADPELLSLGSGLYMTASDHAKKSTVDEMFRPQLSDSQRAVLKRVTDTFHDAMVPEFPPGMPLDHGISGIINLEDTPGKRRKGSMMWQGMANGHWWIDRESGIAATLFVSVLPQGDAVVTELYDELERAVYKDLLPSNGA
ncbi:Acyltransferase LovD [Madurella mycetomatis]|uniref:Acyltransferase LovD n=1 Tax=Madurella mycetomatis TaxID=100816 RepID=A0A175VRF3_9PEZI|nr:Acyltransferase LovD [Madurella mycetomatis]